MGLKEALVLGKLVGKSRWFVLFASFLIISCSGATYIFGLYSPAIKSSLGYDQKTLNTLAFFKDLGANVGIIPGLLNEVCPAWVVVGLGGLMNITGFLLIWLSVTGRMTKPHKWQMFTYIAIGCNSQTFTNTGALVTCVKNFPQSRGIVLGMLKGFAGLSGAIFTQIYHAVYGNDPKSLILLIGWLPCVVCLTFMFVVRPMRPDTEEKELGKFYCFLIIALALAGFLMVVIIIQNHVKFPAVGYKLVAGAVVFFLLLPIVVVVKAEMDRLQNTHKQEPSIEIGDLEKTNKTEPIQEQDCITQSQPHEDQNPLPPPLPSPPASFSRWWFKLPKRGEDFTIPQAMVSIDMWILFIATICGIGAALTAIDNMGQIGSALGFSTVDVSTFVSLISIWNFLGRVSSGFGSEILLHKYSFPRPAILASVLALACIGHLSIAFAIPGSLYVASVVLGFCFGAQWPLIFAMISELFGLKYYSTLYNIAGSASPLGTYVFSVRVAGYLYDLEANKQYSALHSNGTESAHPPVSAHPTELICKGESCFRLTFIIMTCVSLFGAVISGILVLRTRDFYKGDLYAQYQSQPQPQPQSQPQTQSQSLHSKPQDNQNGKEIRSLSV